MKRAYRKLKLQYLQVKFLKESNNLVRKEEQEAVLKMLLSNPKLLFTKDYCEDYTENYLHKYIDTLTAHVKDDKSYLWAMEMLR